MIMKHILFFFVGMIAGSALLAQPVTSYFNGDVADVETAVQSGAVLMGGATESDEAMKWFLQRAGGGDIVVIRSSGSDGYNDYFFSELEVSVNSVETLIIVSDEAANDPYVEQQIRNAEALWIAGGDQWNYVNYWKDSPVEDALMYLISEKGVTVGGTSAGMAILGQAYFSAENGSITTSSALSNPFAITMTVGYDDFLHVPFLEDVITDTHYDSPDRRGRHVAFMARMWASYDVMPRAIASEEYTAVCIDENGIGRVFGGFPNEQDFAYFIQANCEEPWEPETCLPSQPLSWDRDNQALKVYKVPGTVEGLYSFDLSNWHTGFGGEWLDWWVIAGQFSAGPSVGIPDCMTSGVSPLVAIEGQVNCFPNPTSNDQLSFTEPISGDLIDASGRIIMRVNHSQKADVSKVEPGLYQWNTNKGIIRWLKL